MQTMHQYKSINPPAEWRGFTGFLDSWVKSPKFNHIHYLAPDDYAQAFDYIFLSLGRLRKHLITIKVTDTGDGDIKDEITLINNSKKFRIRPI